MASDICLRTILIVRKETRCCHMGYYFWLTARVLTYAPTHRQDNTYHSLCYTSRGALAGTRNNSMGPPHEGSIRRPIAPRSYMSLLVFKGPMSRCEAFIQMQSWLSVGFYFVECTLKNISVNKSLNVYWQNCFQHQYKDFKMCWVCC